MSLRWGIVGCGMMGREHIRNIALVDGASVTAICDPDQATQMAATALVPRAAQFSDLEELLGFAQLDAILIASPNHCHVDQMERIAARRPLPLMVEKPLYTTRSDAERVRRFISYPAPVWVGMEYRYMPPIAALLSEAERVTGGVRMLSIREHRFPFLPKIGDWNRFNRFTGGTLVEKCCHFFDLMRLVLKDEPVRVMASAGQDVNHKEELYAGAVPDVWDSAYVIVDFARGARAMLELCMYAEGGRYQEEICAVGHGGKLEALVPGPSRFWPATLGPPPVPQLVVSPRSPRQPRLIKLPVEPELLAAGDHNGSTYYQHERFLAAVRGAGRVEVGISEGARAVEMALAAQESASTGRAVAL